MRVFNQGAYVRVTVSRTEVEQFKARWPCSGLGNRGYSFTFARNGDLVDSTVPESQDGAAAVALSQNAYRYTV